MARLQHSVEASSVPADAIVDLREIAGARLVRLPWSLRILLENVAREAGGERAAAISSVLGWLDAGTSADEIPFHPGRLLMHDTTCGPALVDIAAMRDALAQSGVDPSVLNPVLPVDVSTDHSIGVDYFGVPDADRLNQQRELGRNAERFRLMKWAEATLTNFRVHPPGTGILHTINLEQLATVVTVKRMAGRRWIVPDTLIGTDSHTPMINGIGVLGWGVGGVEAEAVMFGLPVMMRVPDVIGVRLTGAMREGMLATDLALLVTERLRRHGVAGRFVEFFGPGLSSLTAGDRAVVANMAPEYGATTAYFPIDGRTLDYLHATGRAGADIERVASYARAQALWFDPDAEPRYTDVISIDLGSVGISLAGPHRPQDRLSPSATRRAVDPLVAAKGRPFMPTRGDEPGDGAIAVAAITSCTNTSDPRLLVAAGLLARKARARGLKPKPYVKTSLSPGSPAAARYLARAGLIADLEAIGFGIVGYGCMTCIGNSGPLTPVMEEAVARKGRLPVAVLSGNRNFPGRVHPQIEAGFLASPPLVIAYALAGDVDRDILAEPIGADRDGRPVMLADLWPSGEEIEAVLADAADRDDYAAAFARARENRAWRKIKAPASVRYLWDPASTYLRPPPFARTAEASRLGRYVAEPLIILGDDVTTDQISPAGAIPAGSDAARCLIENGERPGELNVYASRRGNFEVMVRGLFTNRAVRNLLRDDLPASSTVHVPSGEIMPVWRAAERYRRDGLATVILAGERYGAGSSRDWAAKGPNLLGVRAILAMSFERIHRQNLIGLGILPLRMESAHAHPAVLALQPGDRVEIAADADRLAPRAAIEVRVRRRSGALVRIPARAAVDTQLEVELLRQGGVIPFILARAIEGAGRTDAA